MRFYIDGRPYLPATMLNEKIFTIATAIQIGGWSSYMKGWSGYLDDYAIWSSALSAPMMRSTFHCANALGYNAGDMESLLKLYRQKNVSATNIVKGRSWRYASGLRGRMGVCERGVSGSHSILLDISGHGVATVK